MVSTDDEGYFELALPSPELAVVGDWLCAEVEVVAAKVRGLVPARATAELLIPAEGAKLGVISDIDDTVLQTHVTQKLKMIWVTLSGSAFTRMPFEGTSELYHALARGQSGHANNPVFYVSKSPWNLYDFLIDFLDHHGLPRGPLLLRDIGLREAPPVDHKSAAVCDLLEMYPELPFVLIGDSGERDPEIYLEAAARHPGRIVAIYIRDLGGKAGKKSTPKPVSQRPDMAYWFWWPEYNSPSDFCFPILSADATPQQHLFNGGYYDNAKVNTAINKGFSEAGDSKLVTNLWHQAQTVMGQQDPPWLPIGQIIDTSYLRTEVQGYVANPVYVQSYDLTRYRAARPSQPGRGTGGAGSWACSSRGAEPLRVNHIGTRTERRQRVRDLLELVGLSPGHARVTRTSCPAGSGSEWGWRARSR